MEAINSIEYKGMTIQICYDENAESPKKWEKGKGGREAMRLAFSKDSLRLPRN